MKKFALAGILLLSACESTAVGPTAGSATPAVASSDWGSLDCSYWAGMGEAMMTAYQARVSPWTALEGLKPEVKAQVGRPENVGPLKRIMAGTTTYEMHGQPRAKLIAIASYRDNVRSQCLADRG